MSSQRSNITRLVAAGRHHGDGNGRVCKKTRSANGEVSRNWTPPQQPTVHGRARRRGADRDHPTPAPPTHRRGCQPTIGSTSRSCTHSSTSSCSGWTTKACISRASRRCSLALAGADSDAIDLTQYPLDRAQSRPRRRRRTSRRRSSSPTPTSCSRPPSRPTAKTCSPARSIRRTSDRRGTSIRWKRRSIARCRSRFVKTTSARRSCACVLRIRATIRYASQFGAYRDDGRQGGWPTIPAGEAAASW